MLHGNCHWLFWLVWSTQLFMHWLISYTKVDIWPTFDDVVASVRLYKTTCRMNSVATREEARDLIFWYTCHSCGWIRKCFNSVEWFCASCLLLSHWGQKKAGQPCWESGLLCNCMFDDYIPGSFCLQKTEPQISLLYLMFYDSIQPDGYFWLLPCVMGGNGDIHRHPSLFISAVRLWMELSWLYFPYRSFL